MANIDKDPMWDSYEQSSEALGEARANFKTAEHNYLLALQQLRRAEIETNTKWNALIERS